MAKRRKQNPKRLELLAAAVDAINAIADDKSVSHETSIGDLETLASDIDGCIDGLRSDIANREDSCDGHSEKTREGTQR